MCVHCSGYMLYDCCRGAFPRLAGDVVLQIIIVVVQLNNNESQPMSVFVLCISLCVNIKVGEPYIALTCPYLVLPRIQISEMFVKL